MLSWMHCSHGLGSHALLTPLVWFVLNSALQVWFRQPRFADTSCAKVSFLHCNYRSGNSGLVTSLLDLFTAALQVLIWFWDRWFVESPCAILSFMHCQHSFRNHALLTRLAQFFHSALQLWLWEAYVKSQNTTSGPLSHVILTSSLLPRKPQIAERLATGRLTVPRQAFHGSLPLSGLFQK